MAEFVHFLPKIGLKQPSIFLECNNHTTESSQYYTLKISGLF